MVKLNEPKLVTQRPVLILDFNKEVLDFETNLIQQNWVPTVTSTLAQSIQVIRQPDIKVAVAVVGPNKRQVFNAVEKLQNIAPQVKWLAISMKYPVTPQYYARKLSAYFVDYYHCPIDWVKFVHSLGHICGMAKLDNNTNASQLHHIPNHIMVGCSKAIEALKLNLKKVALTDSSILISGETGTGKGLCAHQIHSLSQRKNGPLVTVNCGALPASLIHSELFGHEKGAYTGAESRYIGHIERADKGTLFLDEIGDLPLELQVNLLQFIDEQTIERLGGNSPIKVDCRIILASHIDLENAVAEGRFREDLYHRLNILRIHVPSLREYREDIGLIAREYLERYNNTDHKLCLSSSALESMLRYDWPGNVRELKNRMLRAVVMAESEQITEHELGIKLNNPLLQVANLAKQRTKIDTEVLLNVLKLNDHNVSAASRQLNISRTTFYRLIKKCNIKL